MGKEAKTLDMDLSLKKNNVDEFFFNLSENPEGFKNKDFRYTLSLIYQLIEDEFEGIFASPNSPVRNTDFFLINEGDVEKPKLSFFVTPTNNFQFYLKTKGSMYKFVSKEVEGQIGYIMPLNIVLDYFVGFNDVVDFSSLTETFVYFNKLTHFVTKLIEKLYFIPTVHKRESATGNMFRIAYEPIISNKESARIINMLENNLPKNLFIKGEKPKNFVEKFLREYLNYLVYKFLGIKAYRFKDIRSGHYMLKDLEQKSFLKGKNIAENIAQWFDELYLGKYDLVPYFVINKLSEDEFELKIHIRNRKTDETIILDDLYHKEEIWELNTQDMAKIIEKQLNYAVRYMPELEKLFEDEEKLSLVLNLNEVYKIIAQTSYYLQKAKIEVILPEELTNIIVPRASINAKVKADRSKDLMDLFSTVSNSAISLSDILDFSYEISLGDEKMSLEEFQDLVKDSNGLIQYNGKYIIVDKSEGSKLLEQINSANHKNLTRLELIHASLSGQYKDYDFNYDEAYANILKDFTKPVEVTQPKSLNGELRPYQKTGLKWLWTNVSKGFGSCMADDMGLGKTIQVISLILKLKEENKLKSQVLVVCPTTLMGNWMKEFQMFAPSLDVKTYHGMNRQLNSSCDVIMTTYAIMRIDAEELKKHSWGMVVVDEAQNIKNPDTEQTIAIKSMKSDIKIAMTGTPVENRLTELWSIFDFINHGYLGSLKDFQKSYAVPIEKFKEYSRASKLKLSVSPFVLRRLKTDKSVISDLPEKMIINDYCYLTKTQKILYEKMLNEMMDKISEYTGIDRRGNIFKLITILKQICNHPYQFLKAGEISKELSGKTEKCISTIQNILDNQEKVLIFTQYKEMGDILIRIIEDECNTEPSFFHGSLTVPQRERLIDEFQNDDNRKVMILSLKAGGTGLNLTSATNVIHYDLWWNPAVEEQATDRTYRIGQDKNVMVHRLITLGTFEEKIDEMLKTKKELANIAVFEGEKIITELSDKEIYDIFALSAGG